MTDKKCLDATFPGILLIENSTLSKKDNRPIGYFFGSRQPTGQISSSWQEGRLWQTLPSGKRHWIVYPVSILSLFCNLGGIAVWVGEDGNVLFKNCHHYGRLGDSAS